MKLIVSLDQCFIVFLQSFPHLGEPGKALPLDQLKSFILELAVPSLNLILPLSQFDHIETTFQDVLNNKARGEANRLILAGGCLEGEVTILCMTGLALGFDVYVFGDMLISTDDSYNNLYWNRLIQAGVVPTTMIQMLAEWVAAETDKTKRSNIQQIAKKFGLTGRF